MGSATGAFARDGGELWLGLEPRHDRVARIRFAVEVHMDEWRPDDAADVVRGSASEILAEEIRSDFRCGVVAPAFEDWLFATLLAFATVWRVERVNRPAKRVHIELCGSKTVEGVDVMWDGGCHSIDFGKWKLMARCETTMPLGQSLRWRPASDRTREMAT